MGNEHSRSPAGGEPTGLDLVEYFVNAPIEDAVRVVQLGEKIVRERKSRQHDGRTSNPVATRDNRTEAPEPRQPAPDQRPRAVNEAANALETTDNEGRTSRPRTPPSAGPARRGQPKRTDATTAPGGTQEPPHGRKGATATGSRRRTATGQPEGPNKAKGKPRRARAATATASEYSSHRDPGGAEKLDAASIRLIRQLYGEEKPSTLSRDFGVSVETIERIASPERQGQRAPQQDK